MSARGINEDIDRALIQALACRDDRKRAQTALETLKRKEEESIEHLRMLVRKREKESAP